MILPFGQSVFLRSAVCARIGTIQIQGDNSREKMTRDRGEKKKRIRHEKYIVAACLLLAAGGGLTVLAAKVPKAAQWYTVNIYPYIVSLLGRLFGLFPFSVAEVLLYMLAAAFLISLWRLLFGIFRGQRKGELVFAWFSRVFLGVGILALSFVLGMRHQLPQRLFLPGCRH